MRTFFATILLSSFLFADSEPDNQVPKPTFHRGVPFDAEDQPGIHIWGDADYLCWWTKNAPLQAIVATTGSVGDAAPAALGQPNTQVLFGNKSLYNGALNGFRIAVRSWLDDQNNYALEATGFYLPEKTTNVFSTESANVLGVPFYNVAPYPLPANHGGWVRTNSGETAILLGYAPINYTGSIAVDSSTQLWDVELNGLFHFFSRPSFRLSALGGFAYTDLWDQLKISYASSLSPYDIYSDATIEDRFRTHNEIYTGQVGLRGEWSQGRIFTSFLAKIGLGASIQVSHIDGAFADPRPSIYSSYGVGQGSGIFAQQTNSGRHRQVRFEAIPSATLRFGFNVLLNLRISFGYDILYLSNVLRPGDQIDSTINETQAGSASGELPTLSGPAFPKVLLNTTTYWAQGINAGLEARF